MGLLVGPGIGAQAEPQAAVPAGCRAGAAAMARVELYFGGIDGRRWRRFLRDVVTPRFPDGLTSIDAVGQWRGPHGLQREPAHVVVVFYRPDAASDARIDEIRTLYKRRFRQESVLRVDGSACVGF